MYRTDRIRRALILAIATAMTVAIAGPLAPVAVAARGDGTTRVMEGGPVADLVAASDALFISPDSAATRQQDYDGLKKALETHPDSYDLLWRAARAAWAIGDRLDEDRDAARLKSLGTEALDWADQAVAANPDGIEGRFYHGLAISVYSRGISLMKALFKGLGGKFEGDMEFVIGKDPAWGDGAGERALGRYWYRLPRIKRDLEKSEELLRKAIEYRPNRLRTHLYLADTLALAGKTDEARAEYRLVLDETADPRDVNETETVRGEARKGLEALGT